MEKKIQELIAKDQIREKIYDYARACDRNDIELGASIFTEDSEVDYGKHFPSGSGRAFFEAIIPSHETYFAATTHRLSNVKIKVNGDTAVSETYVCSFNVFKEEVRPYAVDFARGRYLDQWKCVDGEWLIAKRQFLQESSTVLQLDNMSYSWGTRDKNDPVYALFK